MEEGTGGIVSYRVPSLRGVENAEIASSPGTLIQTWTLSTAPYNEVLTALRNDVTNGLLQVNIPAHHG